MSQSYRGIKSLDCDAEAVGMKDQSSVDIGPVNECDLDVGFVVDTGLRLHPGKCDGNSRS